MTCRDISSKNAKNTLDKKKLRCYNTKAVKQRIEYGGIAQLGERLNGIQEVSGSIPLISTMKSSENFGFRNFFFCFSVVLPLKCHFSEPGRYTRLVRYTLS